MRRCNVVRVLFSKEQAKVLETLADRCAALWNAANFRCRQAFLKGEPVPSYVTLCAELQNHPAYKALPSDVAQEVLKIFALRRLWKRGELEKRPGLPGYRKDRLTGKRRMAFIPVKSPRSYSIPARRPPGRSRPPGFAHQGRPALYRHTKNHGTQVRPGKVDVPEPARKARPEKHAAADLGAQRVDRPGRRGPGPPTALLRPRGLEGVPVLDKADCEGAGEARTSRTQDLQAPWEALPEAVQKAQARPRCVERRDRPRPVAAPGNRPAPRGPPRHPRRHGLRACKVSRMLRDLLEAACERAGIGEPLPGAPSAAPPSGVPSGTGPAAKSAAAMSPQTPTRRSTCCLRAPRRGTGRRPRPRGRLPSGGTATGG